MTVPPKWRARRDAIKAALPPVGLVDQPDAGESKHVAYHLARHTSVPPEHLHGVSHVMMSDPEVGGKAGFYSPASSSVHLDYSYTRDAGWLGHAVVTDALVHEIGHHAHHMLNREQFSSASTGTSEAIAENYADRHLPAPRHSEYDRLAHTGDFRTSQYFGRLGGIQDYKSYRAAGKQPGDAPLTESEEWGPDYAHVSQKFHPKITPGRR